MHGVGKPGAGARRRLHRRGDRHAPWLARTGRSRGVGIEAEFIVADADDVGPGEDVPAPCPLAVHVRAVDAHVHQHVSLGCGLDFRMTPAHVGPGDHHVRAGIAPEDERVGPDGVFPPVGQADHPPAGGRRRRIGPGRARRRHQVGERAAVEELGVAGAAAVHREDLVEADLDLVAVEDGGRIGAEPDPVDQELHAGLGGPDGGGALRCPLEHRVQRLDPLTLEVDGALRR